MCVGWRGLVVPLLACSVALAPAGCARAVFTPADAKAAAPDGPGGPEPALADSRRAEGGPDRSSDGPSLRADLAVDRLSVTGKLCDLDEKAPAGWTAGCVPEKQPCVPTIIADQTLVMSGSQAAKFRCEFCGYDSWAVISPSPAQAWDLSQQSHLRFFARSELDNPPFAWQDGPAGKTPWVQLKDTAGGTLRIEWQGSGDMFNGTVKAWVLIEVPLLLPAPSNVWKAVASAGFNAARVASVEIHVDCWDYGFTLWLDRVGFYPACL